MGLAHYHENGGNPGHHLHHRHHDEKNEVKVGVDFHLDNHHPGIDPLPYPFHHQIKLQSLPYYS